jgi:hypothetical protein
MYDARGCRMLILALLAHAVRLARRGNDGASAYVASDDSRAWADVLGLEHWPPTLDG